MALQAYNSETGPSRFVIILVEDIRRLASVFKIFSLNEQYEFVKKVHVNEST